MRRLKKTQNQRRQNSQSTANKTQNNLWVLWFGMKSNSNVALKRWVFLKPPPNDSEGSVFLSTCHRETSARNQLLRIRKWPSYPLPSLPPPPAIFPYTWKRWREKEGKEEQESLRKTRMQGKGQIELFGISKPKNISWNHVKMEGIQCPTSTAKSSPVISRATGSRSVFVCVGADLAGKSITWHEISLR